MTFAPGFQPPTDYAPGFNLPQTPGMGAPSGAFDVAPAIQHDNAWMQIPGQVIGTGVGTFFGGPIGAMAGGQAGKALGGTLGDVFGGNWNGVGQDIWGQLLQGLQLGQQGLSLSPLSLLKGLG